MPEISVIVPVYNVEKYIHRCIDSILAQTFTDFELILVDDGSPDNCGKICDEYAAKDGRIHIIHKKNGGLSDARNVGIDWAFANSDSEWITFIDSDDWIHPMYLNALYESVCYYNCRISTLFLTNVSSESEIVNKSQSINYRIESMEDIFTKFGEELACYVPGRLYKKDLWKEVRFPVGRLWEDVATIYKIMLQVDKIALVKGDWYYYFTNNDGITQKSWNQKKLDELWAYELQLSDREIMSNAKISSRLKEQYIWRIKGQITAVNETELDSESKKKIIRLLRNKLRKALLKYSRDTRISKRDLCYIYESAYPRIMMFYWVIKSRFSK